MRHAQELRLPGSLDVVITGGGTGGHIYSGIAVAKEFKRQFPSTSILFIGTRTGLEAKIVPHEGFALETINIRSFKSESMANKLKNLCKLPYAVYRSRIFLKEFRPHVVFGIGGYVSFPVLYAAYILHIPTMILEPDRQPGFASRLLSKSVNKIGICYQESAPLFPDKKVVFTGTPIRREFSLIGQISPPDKGSKCNILIIAGNRGSRDINCAVVKALNYLREYREQLVFTHQTGEADYHYVKTNYDDKHFRADVLEYIDDIPQKYAKAHLIICRAGTNTVAELTASRRPVILIPYPHRDNYQESNARALEETGAASVILQKDLSGKTLAKAIVQNVQHPENYTQVWSSTPIPDTSNAAEKIVETCLQLIKDNIPGRSVLSN